MIFKLKTSKKTEEIIGAIQASQGLPPYILVKIAISLAIRNNIKLTDDDFKVNNLGLELNRQQVTGEYDSIYKSLISMNEGRHLEDDEFFPKYIKAYLEKGTVMLFSEFKYGNNFYENLANLDRGI